jgi:hypothetical protein
MSDLPYINGREIYECANQLEGYVDEGTPDRLAAFLMREGKAANDLADEIVRLRAKLEAAEARAARLESARPKFDAMSVEQERLAIEFCMVIAGRKGEKASPPDPVRLLEMAEALYLAEVSRAALDVKEAG